MYDQKALTHYLHEAFEINWHGFHGAAHWSRVALWGRRVGEQTGADLMVVQLFALLHDHKREDEDQDPEHGYRAADVLPSLRNRLFHISDKQFSQLSDAIRWHSDGLKSKDKTIQSCWDGDRLDLARVGINPSPEYLSKQGYLHAEKANEMARQWYMTFRNPATQVPAEIEIGLLPEKKPKD
jgi:uncharacterized protein